ncbi:ABC transporter permease [Marinicella sediminis]|uniref:ABC transporter permease n=1 Tax=Marinicella sediminis TaxID=1792834 RepID=A0ABV7JBH8_9GAMM|nr:ABC transporter permease [Marinicella sediminis]
MKKIWLIAQKDFLYTLKDKTVLVWLFVMPLVFFAFIGTTTQGFGGGSGSQTTLAVWYEGDVDDPMFKQIQNRLETESFALRLFNPDQLLYQEKWAFDDYDRQLWIPAGMAQQVAAGEQVTLNYRVDAEDMGGDFATFKINKAIYQTLGDLLIIKKLNTTQWQELDFSTANDAPRMIDLQVSQAGEQQEIPSGFKQAVPGILVMFIMMIALTSGALALFLERKTGVLRRLAASPITRRELILGKWLGKWMLATCQLIYGMIMGSLLFSIHWGPHWPMVFVLLLSWAAACAGFAIMMGSMARNEGQVNGIPVIVSMLLAALGGCWWPIEVAPEWMQQLAMFLPTGWVMDALHKLMYFGADLGDVFNHQLALYSLAVIALILAFTKFNHEVK